MNNNPSDNDIDNKVTNRIYHITHKSFDQFGYYSKTSNYHKNTLDTPKLTILRKSPGNGSVNNQYEGKKSCILNVLCNDINEDIYTTRGDNINVDDKKPTQQGWYYVNKKGETKGPVSARRLKILYNARQLKDNNYVWNGFDVKHWTPLKNIKIFNTDAYNEKTFFKNCGYKKDIFIVNTKITDDIDEYLCGICNNICRECVELSCDYGHLFCKSCITQHMKINKRCPKCCVIKSKNRKLEFHKIQYVERKIQDLQCKCCNYKKNCLWIGTINKLDSHLRNECKFVEKNGEFKEENKEIKCINNEEDIDERIVKCLYYKIGCFKSMKYKQLNQHLNEYVVKHNQLQFIYFNLMVSTHKYIYVSSSENISSSLSLSINGLYKRINMNGMKPMYKKEESKCFCIKIRFNFEYNKWIFETKDKKILLIEKDNKNDNEDIDPCNALFETDQTRINLIGFTDLYLFRQLNLLQSAEFIEIVGRKGINIEMNGVYQKQNNLHEGKPWYIKISNDDNHNHKYQWVIRYFSSSELWLFDKRGLRNDDIANGIGHGDTLSPLQISTWEIHNGKTFVLDKNVQIRKYCSN